VSPGTGPQTGAAYGLATSLQIKLMSTSKLTKCVWNKAATQVYNMIRKHYFVSNTQYDSIASQYSKWEFKLNCYRLIQN
jgi:hypothetical protein